VDISSMQQLECIKLMDERCLFRRLVIGVIQTYQTMYMTSSLHRKQLWS